MKIAIISDTHFGFKENTELETDCYSNFEQALNYAMQNCDVILMPGDIFDLEEPSSKTMNYVFKILSKYVGKQKIKTNLEDKILIKPIIAIAGTHEYKGKDYISPIDILENSKYIYQLKHNNIIVNNENEDIAIFGMSGVPEKVAKDVLKKINFQPIKNYCNILMTHQSYNELLAFDDEMISNLSFEDLPDGFDLYINGHLHKKYELSIKNSKFIIPGSTIITQIKKNEIKEQRGFCIYNTKDKNIKFVPIEKQREHYYYEINEENTNKENIVKNISEILEKHEIENELKPIIKIKINAKINFGEKNISEKDFLSNNYILMLDKKLEVKELKSKLENINFSEDKELALSNSKNIFIQNLKDANFNNSFNVNAILPTLKDNPDLALKEILLKIDKESS